MPLAAAVAASVVALPPSPAHAWCQMTSRADRGAPGECLLADPPTSWPLAWRRRCSSISLSHAMPSRSLRADQVRAILRTSLDTWEQVDCGGMGPTGLHVEVLEETNGCTEASHHNAGANVNALMFVSEGWTVCPAEGCSPGVVERMHAYGAYAVTLVWHDRSSGEIWDVDIEVNEELAMLRADGEHVYGVCPADGCPTGLVDLQNVLTHELGHYFGLAHTPDDPLATMWAEASADETIKRDLRPDDVAGLCAIYPPGLLPAECDPTPRGGLALDCSAGGGCTPCAAARGAPTPAALGPFALALLLAIALRSASRRARATSRRRRIARSHRGRRAPSRSPDRA